VAPETKNIQKPFFDPDGYWAAVYMMPNVIGYNIGAGEDFNKNFELFRAVFGAPKS